MNFIKAKTEIKLIVPLDALEAKKVEADLKILLANVNPTQLNLLTKAVQNPFIKTAALAKLNEQFNNNSNGN